MAYTIIPHNPFAHLDAPFLPQIEMLKIFLAFISGVLMCRLAIAASIVIFIGGFALVLSYSSRPSIRGWSLWFVRLGARLLLFTFGFYSIAKRGKKDKRVKLLVSNHVGFLEILWFIYHDCPAFVMKRELTRIALISQLATRVLGSVVVSHGESQGGGGAAAIVGYVQGDPKRPLLVFPEGTTTNGIAILPFRKGWEIFHHHHFDDNDRSSWTTHEYSPHSHMHHRVLWRQLVGSSLTVNRFQ